MTGFLDTHTLLWWDNDTQNLSPAVLAFCQDANNRLLVSVASLWEIQIKVMQGRLSLRDPLSVLVARQESNGIRFVPVFADHVYGLKELPPHHKDPFDRIIIAQSRFEGAVLLSRDEQVAAYAPLITLLW